MKLAPPSFFRTLTEEQHLRRTATMVEGLLYTDEAGREWTVTLEAPGKVLSVPPSLEKSGALLPEHEIRIVFSSGGETFSEEYTALTALEDLSDSEIQEWLDAARRGRGL
jgi:hypothetical protein